MLTVGGFCVALVLCVWGFQICPLEAILSVCGSNLCDGSTPVSWLFLKKKLLFCFKQPVAAFKMIYAAFLKSDVPNIKGFVI